MRSTHRVEHYGGTVGTSNAEGAVSALAATVLLSPNAITGGYTGNIRSRASAVAFPHSAHPLDCLAEDLSISSEVESDVSTTSAAKCRSGR